MKSKPSGVLPSFLFLALAVSGAAPAAASGLYENVDVIGSITCELDRSMAIIVDEGRALRCDFESESVPDSLNRYFVHVRGIDAGSGAPGDVLVWTVLKLKDTQPELTRSPDLSGLYGRVLPSVAQQYAIGSGALVGGPGMSFALEPRSTVAGKNAANSVSMLEVSR